MSLMLLLLDGADGAFRASRSRACDASWLLLSRVNTPRAQSYGPNLSDHRCTSLSHPR